MLFCTILRVFQAPKARWKLGFRGWFMIRAHALPEAGLIERPLDPSHSSQESHVLSHLHGSNVGLSGEPVGLSCVVVGVLSLFHPQ